MSSGPLPRSLRWHQSVTLGLLFVAGVINFFDRSSLSIANNTIRGELHLTGTEMGWLLSAFSLAYGLAQLPLTGLMARAGTRAVLGAGLGLWSTAQLLTGLVRGLPLFLVLRVLLGIGESPFYPCGVQSVRDWFPERARGRATALMSMSQTLGLAVAPPVLSLLILRIGWRAMFMGLGAAGLLAALAWSTLYRARDTTEHGEAAENNRWLTKQCGLLKRRLEAAAAAADGMGHDARLRGHQLHKLAVYRLAARLPADGTSSFAGQDGLGGGYPVSCRGAGHAVQRAQYRSLCPGRAAPHARAPGQHRGRHGAVRGQHVSGGTQCVHHGGRCGHQLRAVFYPLRGNLGLGLRAGGEPAAACGLR